MAERSMRQRSPRSRHLAASALLALGVAALAWSPAQAQWGTIADIADFEWISPDTDADGDVKYEVSGTTDVKIKVTGKNGRRFEWVKVSLISGATSHPPLCQTTWSGTLPTDFPAAIDVDFRWEAFTAAADGAAVSCTGGGLADDSTALGSGQLQIGVTVKEALNPVQTTEGQSRQLEAPGSSSPTTTTTTTTPPQCDEDDDDCDDSTTTTTEGDDDCDDDCDSPSTTTPKGKCTGGCRTDEGRGGSGGGGGAGGGDNGSSSGGGGGGGGATFGPGASGGGDDSSGESIRGSDGLATRVEGSALGASSQRAVRARSPLLSMFISGGSVLSPLLIIAGLAVLAVDRWWLLAFARRRRRGEEDDTAVAPLAA